MLEPDSHYLSIYGRPLGGGSKRRRPSNSVADEILESQRGCCMYCGIAIGARVYRWSAIVVLRLNWDHFVPHSFLAANPTSNWVAACHVCNDIKSSKIFDTVTAARRFVRNRRAELGYSRAAVSELAE
jgi:5-methylcytosine-specific restriction endonuclease McrA